MNDEIDGGCAVENELPAMLAKATLEPVSRDSGLPVFGYDQANTGVLETRKGSDHPNIEMFGSESLPCSCDAAQFVAACDAATVLERRGLTRRRTCSGAAR